MSLSFRPRTQILTPKVFSTGVLFGARIFSSGRSHLSSILDPGLVAYSHYCGITLTIIVRRGDSEIELSA